MKNNLLLGSVLTLTIWLCSSRLSFESFPKIDAHVHIDTSNPAFVKIAQANNFRLMTLVTGSGSQQRIDRQLAWASSQHRAFPKTVAYSTTICMENWNDADWQAKTIAKLEQDFVDGAVAVKIWKDIGMTFRDADSSFIMIDDARLDPIFDFIASKGKTVVGHLGEPRNCWLPLDSMTVRGDSSYYAEHPQYHMFLHPDYPSYEQQIAARDHFLAKHPNLRFVGAHLGSLEWNVDELAKRLDLYPNMAVDMAARICHFQIQDREKVRNFIIKYQDRLLYGTDLEANDQSQNFDWNVDTWKNDWRYFTTSDSMTSPNTRTSFQGLALPRSVLKKIYYENAMTWLKGWR
jgi:predicted TIM-barrel fold metal-dependent hydrolase